MEKYLLVLSFERFTYIYQVAQKLMKGKESTLRLKVKSSNISF